MAGAVVVVLVPVTMLVLLRRLRIVRRREFEDPIVVATGRTGSLLWMEPTYVAFLHGLGPSIVSAIAIGLGFGAIVRGSWLCAGGIFALGLGPAAWRWPMAKPTGQKSGWAVEVVCAAMVLLLVVSDRGRPQGTNGQQATLRKLPVLSGPVSRAGGGLSGVILTLPPRPHENVLPPPPARHGELLARTMPPIRIEFDGVYWYFQAPDHGPRKDAKVVPGDPTRAQIRSTDYIPLQMEAHQHLPPFTSLDLYREIVVRMRDADHVPGLIRISLLLTTMDGTEPLLLGTRVLAASRTQQAYADGPATDEDLRFAVLPAAHGRIWSEMVVRVEPERERAQAGAHVMVKNFLLEP